MTNKMIKENQETEVTLGHFHSILSDDQHWRIGGFPLPNGDFHSFREPEAVVIVRNDHLYVRANPLTRTHDHIQFLDNAKHMYYSNKTFAAPEDGFISFELSIRARAENTLPHDLYDGFVSLNLLDFSTGAALDFFAGNDKYASVYAVLPFPGVQVPETDKTKYFCIFKEETDFKAREFNTYKITYHRGNDEVIFTVNDHEIRREKNVPIKFNDFTVALGLMTEKDLSPEGSTSLHGQGIIGEWSPIMIKTGK